MVIFKRTLKSVFVDSNETTVELLKAERYKIIEQLEQEKIEKMPEGSKKNNAIKKLEELRDHGLLPSSFEEFNRSQSSAYDAFLNAVKFVKGTDKIIPAMFYDKDLADKVSKSFNKCGIKSEVRANGDTYVVIDKTSVMDVIKGHTYSLMLKIGDL